MTPALKYVIFSNLTGTQRDAVQAIYEEAFPAWERMPFDNLIRRNNDQSRLQLAMIQGEGVLGLAVASRLRAVPWTFLEYFAVSRAWRNQGLGGVLWDAMIRRLGKQAFPMVLEVEPPEEEPPRSPGRTIRERRIEFYRRRGANRLDVPNYRVPHQSDEGTDKLALLAVPLEGARAPTNGGLRDLVRSLYVEGYGLPDDHTLLVGALDQLAAGASP